MKSNPTRAFTILAYQKHLKHISWSNIVQFENPSPIKCIMIIKNLKKRPLFRKASVFLLNLRFLAICIWRCYYKLISLLNAVVTYVIIDTGYEYSIFFFLGVVTCNCKKGIILIEFKKNLIISCFSLM